MKKLKSLFFAGLAISSVLFYQSCSPDEGGLTDDLVDITGPALTFIDQDPSGLFLGNYPTSDFTVSANESTIYLGIDATAGSADLKVLTIQVDGVNVDPLDLTFRDLNSGEDVLSNNPYLINGANVDAITFEIGIANAGELSSKTIEITVEDNDGRQETISIGYSNFQAIETTIEGVLLNRAGPAGQGGLDLDNGSGTGTVMTDPTAELGEIKDEGIDINLPNDQNWKNQISAMNNAEIRTLSSSVENFSFDAVSRVDEIQAYFDNGSELPNTNDDDEKVSDKLTVGDVFTVSRDGKVYLIEVTDITETADNNNDAVEFRIKY